MDMRRNNTEHGVLVPCSALLGVGMRSIMNAVPKLKLQTNLCSAINPNIVQAA